MKERRNMVYWKDRMIAMAGIGCIVLFSFGIIALSGIRTSRTYRDMAERQTECYMSIQVQPGESLWEISKRYYSSEYKDLGQYMDKIMTLNHMANENQINAGTYLIIPYYEH